MKEMVGGCCVCSDDRGWAENPLVYCDGPLCTVAVHQACYGIVTVPKGNWYCRKCECQQPDIKVNCQLCPNGDGALKPTDNGQWAHVVCALYIPEVRFGNVTTMEPIILAQIPAERFNKTCYICEEGNKGNKAGFGACMQCNKSGCRQQFHVTCAQGLGLLCEEAGNYLDNVKYCGYCHHHYTKVKKGGNVKVIPPYRPFGTDSPEQLPKKETDTTKATNKRKLSSGSVRLTNKPSEEGASGLILDEALPDPPKFTTANFTSSTLETDKLGNKKRKGGAKTPPAVSEEARPMTPGSDKKPVAGKASPPQVTKPTAAPANNPPLEIPAAPPVPQTSSSPSPVVPTVSSPPPSQQDHPIKRARSQSSDKSEKGRRPKRAGSKPTPPPSTSPPLKIVMEEQIDPRAKKPVVVKEEKDIKLFHNGVNAPHMLGNQLNPSSTMAQKMCDTLSQEMVAHSVFSPDQNNLMGPQLPKPCCSSRNATNAVNSALGGNWNHHTIPQSLEQLLERQWEQGSQFLMEQAQHFDIASLLSCLHQLTAENTQLEDHVTTLLQRRDHLLAVNARLAIPLVPPVTPTVTTAGGVRLNTTNSSSNTTASLSSQQTVVENGLASPSEQQQSTAWRGSRTGPSPHQPLPSSSFPPSNPPQGQNTVVVRATTDLLRRGRDIVVGSQVGNLHQASTSNTNSYPNSSLLSTASTNPGHNSVATTASSSQQGLQAPLTS